MADTPISQRRRPKADVLQIGGRTLKPATLETGAQINIPLFVEIGEKIRVNTETGDYMERVK